MSMLDGVFGILRTITSAGSAVPSRATLDFTDGLQAIDDADNGKTLVSLRADTRTALVNALTAGAYDGEKRHCDGYYARGDGGGGMFVWDEDNVDTAVPGMVIGTGTGRWVRVFDGPVNVRWFGAKGDGTGDDQPAIKSAVDYAFANGGSVYMPSGTYPIDRTIHLRKPGAAAFDGILLFGDGRVYRDSAYGAGTLITTTFSDAPAINIQGARGTVVRDIGIVGLNADWVESNGLGISFAGATPPLLDDTDGDNWVDTGLDANADSRYAPYAGIAIDGWSGTEPTPHYPADEVSYGMAFSSDIQIENVYISGFVVGVACQPCDADGNGDFLKILNTYIERCKYAVSIGNSQARNTAIRDCTILFTWCCFTNKAHGKQIGKFAGSIDNLSVAFCNRLFEFTNSYYWGPLVVTQLYAETLWKIGRLDQSGESGRSIRFIGCELAFHAQLCPERGVPSCVIDDAYGRTQGITFEGCSFLSYPSVLSFYAPGVQLIDCNLMPAAEVESNAGTAKEPIIADTPPAYIQTFRNATGGFCPKNLRCLKSHSYKNTIFNLNTNVVHLSRLAAEGEGTYTSRPYCVSAWVREPANEYGQRIVNSRFLSVTAKSSLSSCTFTRNATKPGELVLTFSSLPDWQAQQEGYMPGDALYDDETGAVFVIRSRSTVTVTAEIQNNYRWNGSAYVAREAEFSTSTGNLYALNCRIYTPATPIFGDVAATSSSITNAGTLEGTAGAVLSTIEADDWFYARDQLLDYDIGATSAKVSAIHASGSPITLGGAAQNTRARKQLALLVRDAPANAGSR